jgi:hypothetical protein
VIDDAIGSLRTLFSASLAVLVLWLVTWPATGEKLALFAAAVELHEWVALKDRLGRLESSVFETSPGQAISGEAETAQRIAPNDELYDRPDTEIVVSTTWPERRSYTITLEPVIYDPKGLADRARAYQVTGRDLPLSWGQLYAVFRRVDPERDVEDPTALDEEPRGQASGRSSRRSATRTSRRRGRSCGSPCSSTGSTAMRARSRATTPHSPACAARSTCARRARASRSSACSSA